MPENEVYEEIVLDIQDRLMWERRQILWSRMRNHGVRRQSLPWPGAANAHVPIGDTIITKLKPYYIQWIFGPELLSSFYSLEDQGESYTNIVAQWFDYKVRECSNFPIQCMCGIDSCLQNGNGILKTYWDVDKERLAFASVHPYYIVVPPNTQFDLSDADRVVHVMHYTRAQYERAAEARGLNAEEDYLDSITGEGTHPDAKYEHSRYIAEGLSYSHLKDLIVLWEVYERQSDGQIEVQTFSPLQPDEPAREPFRLPYDHKQMPFTILPYEVTDGSFYSSRGIMELVQMYEASATKSWNEKLDFMSIANRPVLTTQGGSINAQNIRWEPGAAYDGTVTLVQQPPPPVSFDQEIQSTRAIAEQRVGIPDFGLGQDNQPLKSRTATETNAITTVMQQSNDLRSRIVKDCMTRIFEQSWSILKQYDRKSLDYLWNRRKSQLPDAAFDNKYLLRSNGSVDGYSREREVQKLMQLRQLSQGAPWIKEFEIDRKIIELMDAQWIDQLYEPPPDAQADQQEQQAIENSIMVDGFLPEVKPDDQHLVHLQTWDGYLQWRPQHGQPPLPPDVMSIFMQHGANHVMAARQNAQYWKQFGQQIQPFAQKIAATQKQMAQQQAQQAGQMSAMQSKAMLRGGRPPMSTNGAGVPGAGMPPLPQGPPLPQPGVPNVTPPSPNGGTPPQP
jgi:hypothetical protein